MAQMEKFDKIQERLPCRAAIVEKSKIKEKKDVERSSREIKILKQVHHPNVVQLYEIIETDEDLYLVMEFA